MCATLWDEPAVKVLPNWLLAACFFALSWCLQLTNNDTHGYWISLKVRLTFRSFSCVFSMVFPSLCSFAIWGTCPLPVSTRTCVVWLPNVSWMNLFLFDRTYVCNIVAKYVTKVPTLVACPYSIQNIYNIFLYMCICMYTYSSMFPFIVGRSSTLWLRTT